MHNSTVKAFTAQLHALPKRRINGQHGEQSWRMYNAKLWQHYSTVSMANLPATSVHDIKALPAMKPRRPIHVLHYIGPSLQYKHETACS